MNSLRFILKNRSLLILVIIAFIFHMIIIVPSGSYLCFQNKCGYYFWGAHGHDSIWHLSLVNVAFEKFPFLNPVFAGENLQGYNFLLDLVIFLFSLIGIPAIITFFKIMPLIWFTLFTWAAVVLARKIVDSARFVFYFLFFAFFGGSFGYLLTLYHHKTLSGSESLLAMQAGHMMLNVQYGFSLVVLMVILTLLLNTKSNLKINLLLGLLVSINLGLKFYAGIISLFSIFLFKFFELIKTRNFVNIFKDSFVILVFFIASLFVFYHPLVFLKEPTFIFSPFAIVHSMIEEPDLFYLKDLVNARYFLEPRGFGPRLLAIELFTLLIYIVFNFGTRILGTFYFLYSLLRKKVGLLDLGIFIAIIFSIFISVAFIQRGVWWNTVQFFYYAIFLSNIYVAKLLYKWDFKKYFVLVFAILLLTVPINVDFIYEFTKFPGHTYIPASQLKALDFLRKQPKGVVLSSAFDKNLRARYSEPYPINVYADTSYVSAFSKKISYVADEDQLSILGVDFKKRKEETWVWNCSLRGRVDYLFEVKEMRQEKKFKNCKDKIKKIYQNEDVVLYKLL